MLQLTAIITIAACWIFFLNKPLGSVPALGKLLNPVSGMWANAESVSKPDGYISLPFSKDKRFANVTFNERLVPHIKASTDRSLYFTLGYLHAHYRLWQMDMQTRAAAGRVSEVVGEKAFEFDRYQRRKGMLWAAENSLKAMEKDSTTLTMLNAYTEGVNLFISRLKYKDFPIEYKLMGFEPEPWTNLKVALLLKYMADDLTGKTDDIAMSYLRANMSEAEIDNLFPDFIANSAPVIPAGTAPSMVSQMQPYAPYGNLFADFKIKDTNKKSVNLPFEERPSIGSNNWAIGGELTADSAAILCNDPHLGLNLPSIWYEAHLTAPGINCYGVSIPGAPGIIIGFNDSISWGFTNNYRDVKDYFEIIQANDHRLYKFDNKEVPFNYRYEIIMVKGHKTAFTDTIKFTIHGPVVYDSAYPEPGGSHKQLAMMWMGHKGTNELLAVYHYNRATNYTQFLSGIKHFECPAQNFAFADRLGNIAIIGQGTFINKWRNQGKYVMRGDISTTLWGNTIPAEENPKIWNPQQGYVASANQTVTDALYPYWYNGNFSEFRSWAINGFIKAKYKNIDTPDHLLSINWYPFVAGAQSNTISDMDWNAALQNNNLSILNGALVQHLNLQQWLPINDAYNAANLEWESEAATTMQIFWYKLYRNIWDDEFEQLPVKLHPSSERTLQLILTDSSSKYFDNKNTPKREYLADMVNLAVTQTKDSIAQLKSTNGLVWFKVKNTSIQHLTKLSAFSYEGLKTGGWGNTINAMKQNHGPSWRMIVKMHKSGVEAQVVYPGGQSGNPGSKYYGNFIPNWVNGKYYSVKL